MKEDSEYDNLTDYEKIYTVTAVAFCLFFSCGKIADRLTQALEISGANRTELQKVLDRYSSDSADSLKLKAARFLIENIPGHFTYSGEYLDRYIHYMDSSIRICLIQFVG